SLYGLGGIGDGNERGQSGKLLVGVQTHVLTLVVAPPVVGLPLKNDLFGVRSVAEQRNYGHGYSKKCHGQRYGSQLPIVCGVFSVLLQFLEFVAHSGAPSGNVCIFRTRSTNLKFSSAACQFRNTPSQRRSAVLH